jgi:hypothetical protein
MTKSSGQFQRCANIRAAASSAMKSPIVVIRHRVRQPESSGKWGYQLTLTAYEISAAGSRIPLRLPAGKLEIDPALLAVTIRRRIVAPETCADIGTMPGLCHLIQDTSPIIGP